MSEYTLIYRIHNEGMRIGLSIKDIEDKMKEYRLRWFGDVL